MGTNLTTQDITKSGPATGNSVVKGSLGSDFITVYGWGNTIYGHGGNDTVNAGAGNTTIYVGPGQSIINLSGWNNTIIGKDPTV